MVPSTASSLDAEGREVAPAREEPSHGLSLTALRQIESCGCPGEGAVEERRLRLLREDLYAVAALAGAAVVVAGHLLDGSPIAATLAGAALCFGIRLAGIRRGWSLPTAS
jgi:hypothetical protein